MKQITFTIKLIANYLILTWENAFFGHIFLERSLQLVRAQAANSPLVWRTGEQFRALALAEHERFKRVAAQHNLPEK